jgi:hypothetical protein
MKKITRLKKVKKEKITDIGNYEVVQTTHQEADDGKTKVRILPPIKIRLK